jgi:spermidine/putrescine transport system substrate-binding protein
MLRGLVLAVLAAGLVAAACGEADGGPSTLGAPNCVAGQTDGDLLLYNWTNYLPTGAQARRVQAADLVAAFEEEYGVQVSLSTYTSNEELHASLLAGAEYDVIVPSDYMVSILIGEDRLRPLQMSAIPNRVNVGEAFRNPPFDPDDRFHVPYLWGTTGIGIALVNLPADLPQSWDLIFDPEVSSVFGGKISLLDDPRETLGAALRYLGHSLNSTNEAEIREAGQLLADTLSRGDVAVFDSTDYAQRLAAGDVLLAHGYSGDFFWEFAQLAAVGHDPSDRFAYFVPEEGAVLWVDAMAVPANAPHPCTAHTFIDYILRPLVGAELAEFNGYGTPNAAAEYLVDPEILADPAINPPPEVFERLEFIADLGPEIEALYAQVFADARG